MNEFERQTLDAMGTGGWAAIKLAAVMGVSRERMSVVLQNMRQKALVEHNGAWSSTREGPLPTSTEKA